MTYTRNQPVASDNFSVSQPILLANTNAADDSFGIEHYKFSNATSSNGLHNTVTTPTIVGAAHPTTTTYPIFYGMVDSANAGLLQYTRGVSNAVPFPLTPIQSTAGGIVLSTTPINIFDFTPLTSAMFVLSFTGTVTSSGVRTTGSIVGSYLFTGPSTYQFAFDLSTNFAQFTVSSTTSILKLASRFLSQDNVFWTLQFLRLGQ